MRKIFEFVKIGGTWFYWWSDFKGYPHELVMKNGSDSLLDSFLEDRFVRLVMVDKSIAQVILTKTEETSEGATYLCKSKRYNGSIWLSSVALDVLGDYPQIIYLKEL